MTKHTTGSELPSLAGAPWLVRPETQAVFAALRAAGFPARAVGGVVRNALMDLPVTDIDIATPAAPDEVIAACRAARLATVATGIEHGTVTVVAGGERYEVTTLRRDVATDGRRATVAFTGDWALDAGRRDFTFNALYCDADGAVHDPLGGYGDLLARRVRFIGDAGQRIREDYLRILRFFRFHAALGAGEPDRAALEACAHNSAGLSQLSAERVRGELVKLLVAPGALAAIETMGAFGLLSGLLSVAPRPGVLAAMIAAERSLARPPEPMLRLAALAVSVREDIPRLAGRLRLSNAEAASLIVVDGALGAAIATLDGAAARRYLYHLGVPAFRRQVAGALAAGAIVADAARALDRLPEAWPCPKLPVQGADVLALGLAPGPAVGVLLAEIEAWWTAADFPPERQVRDRLATLATARKG